MTSCSRHRADRRITAPMSPLFGLTSTIAELVTAHEAGGRMDVMATRTCNRQTAGASADATDTHTGGKRPADRSAYVSRTDAGRMLMPQRSERGIINSRSTTGGNNEKGSTTRESAFTCGVKLFAGIKHSEKREISRKCLQHKLFSHPNRMLWQYGTFVFHFLSPSSFSSSFFR